MSVLILDTETTGLPSAAWARVVELGAVVLDPHADYAEVAAFDTLVYPAGFDPATDAAGLAHCGISANAVLYAPVESEVRARFAVWCTAHRVTEVFSFNRVFDEGMLKRSGFELPWTGCVMRLARAAMPGRKKDPSLAEAVAHFALVDGVEQAHRALPDARRAGRVFAALRRKAV